MCHKIFISYKFSDDQVKNLKTNNNSTVRDYVDEVEKRLKATGEIYKGEEEDEDLSELSDDTIWEKLKSRIYDSTITIILISPGMKEKNKRDRDQWIPWEISYSLKETSRINKKGVPVKSRANAMLAVMLPDSNGSYEYYQKRNECCKHKCLTCNGKVLFKIIRKNMFNKINAHPKQCYKGKFCWYKGCSYIDIITWDKFIKNINKYISEAWERKETIDEYNIVKEI